MLITVPSVVISISDRYLARMHHTVVNKEKADQLKHLRFQNKRSRRQYALDQGSATCSSVGPLPQLPVALTFYMEINDILKWTEIKYKLSCGLFFFFCFSLLPFLNLACRCVFYLSSNEASFYFGRFHKHREDFSRSACTVLCCYSFNLLKANVPKTWHHRTGNATFKYCRLK